MYSSIEVIRLSSAREDRLIDCYVFIRVSSLANPLEYSPFNPPSIEVDVRGDRFLGVGKIF